MSMKEKSVNCLGKAGFHRIAYTEWARRMRRGL